MARRRVTALVLAAASACAVVAGCGSPPPPGPPPGPLRILLVSANGWTSPGILTLQDALKRAGHSVTQVSPLVDRTESGTAVTRPPGEISAGPPTGDPSVWAVSGTASDATVIALRGLMGNKPPDLVISGIDSRPNVSVGVASSGTVGAAMTAAELGCPSVAVSTDQPDPTRPVPGAFDSSATFVVRLVAALQQHPEGAPLMPLHTVLNVNYPTGAAGRVANTTTADFPSTITSLRPGSRPGSYLASTAPGNTKPEDDVRALAEGDVTLTDLSADPDRTQPPPRTAARLASLLRP